MKTFFLDQTLAYNGTQLKSHWINQQTHEFGDAVAAFIGPCQVDLSHLVDLEDVQLNQPIFSEQMLHFIIEHFDADLEKMILRQRLFIALMQTELQDWIKNQIVIRRGDDLFIDQAKLTVSIATKSPVSSLIHTGINICSKNTPVPTLGLADFDINPQAFARSMMNRYVAELNEIDKARCKVRAVE